MSIIYGPDFAPRGLRTATDYLVVHCSAGHPDAKAEAVVRFHMEVRGWRSCGYHAVIERDGTVVQTLHPDAIGAHIGDVKRVGNGRAYGVCLGGGVELPSMKPVNNYTLEQMNSLGEHLLTMKDRYPGAVVTGHRDLIRRFGASPKACPCFDVEPWWRGLVEAVAAVDDEDAGDEVADETCMQELRALKREVAELRRDAAIVRPVID